VDKTRENRVTWLRVEGKFGIREDGRGNER